MQIPCLPSPRLLRTALVTAAWILYSTWPQMGLAAPETATDQQQLAWQFTPDETLHYRMTQSMQMSMNMGAAGTTKTDMQQDIDMSWKVVKADADGVATISQKIDRMRMKMKIGEGQSVEYDSQSDAPPQGMAAMIAPVMKELTKTSFEVQMTPRGKVLDVVVPDALIQALKTSPGAAQMGNMLSKDGFKQMIEKGSPVLPADVTPGATWNTQVEMANAASGTVTVQTTYEYKGQREVEGEQMAVIGQTLEMTFGEGQDPAGPKINVVEQDSAGEVLFNRDAGRLESSHLKMNMKSNITQQGQAMTQQIEQTVDMRYISPEQLKAEQEVAK